MMSRLQDILTYNEQFVANQEYEPYRTSKLPDKKIVVVSCMDTRLTELLPRALNLKNGDAKIVKNAGAIVSDAFDGTMRSILVAVYDLGAEEVFVIGHHGCGMTAIHPEATLQKIRDNGVSDEVIQTLEHAGVDLHKWLARIDSVPDSVRDSVRTIVEHPLMPKWLKVHGLVIDPETGKLDLVVDGDK